MSRPLRYSAVAESGEPIDIAEAVVTAESSRSCDCNIPNAIPGNVIAVTEEEASKLIERFGRMYNVETSVATQHIDMAGKQGSVPRSRAGTRQGSAPISSTATVSGATRAVDWNKDELEAIAQDAAEGKFQPGDTRTVSGRIRQTVYPVPFAVERADPSVFACKFNGKPMFMFIATDDTDGNCVDPNDGATHNAVAHRRFHRSAFRCGGAAVPRKSICSNAVITTLKRRRHDRLLLGAGTACHRWKTVGALHAMLRWAGHQSRRHARTIAQASRTCGRAAAISCSSSSIPIMHGFRSARTRKLDGAEADSAHRPAACSIPFNVSRST